MKRCAFTLIELLIVVAIIAILAAIAVPNLLEAQTRSKVARTLADMRTIIHGFTAYRVDNQWIPAEREQETMAFVWYRALNGKESGVGRLLTSPIPYLSTKVPYDIFNTNAYRKQIVHSGTFFVQSASVALRARGRFDPTWSKPGTGAWTWAVQGGRIIYYNWFIASTGPDLTPWGFDSAGKLPAAAYYDPTNGTVSWGDITYVDTVGWVGGVIK
jgi:prepilin-type N-terminal cleavage/methylation domain-containing protein